MIPSFVPVAILRPFLAVEHHYLKVHRMATPPLDHVEGLERASHTDQARSDPSPVHCDLLGLMGRNATRAAVARCNALERKGAEIRGPEVFLIVM